MKRGIRFVLAPIGILTLAVFFSGTGRADTVYCADGRIWHGIICAENDSTLDLDIGFDKVKLDKSKIVKIKKGSLLENQKLRVEIEANRAKRMQWLSNRTKEPKEVMVSGSGGHLFADVLINDRVKASLLVDTGATLVVLTKGVARKLGLELSDPRKQVSVQGADGKKIKAFYVKLNSLELRGVRASEVDAVILMEDKPNMGFKDGLLGMSFLGRFNFQMDHRNKKLVFRDSGT